MNLSKNINTLIGDITKIKCDAIVNAANSLLLGGGGVDGAIHSAGGSEILDECIKLRETLYRGGLPTGEAVATTAGKMDAKIVIHTVGPIYDPSKDQSILLENCYLNSLGIAFDNNCNIVAFPAISTGIYGYPKDEAAKIAYASVFKFVKNHDIEVIFVFSCAENEFAFLESVRNIQFNI